MTRAKAHMDQLQDDGEGCGFGTMFTLKNPKSRVMGQGQLGIVLAVDGGDQWGRTLVVTFEGTPNSTFRIAPGDITVVRK